MNAAEWVVALIDGPAVIVLIGGFIFTWRKAGGM